ncbi:MAG: protease modulator HflC [Gammaproteobacteria bacterium]|nr:protease modulator HflC [Gammaproteobacteria bacterium]MDH5303872.1 protease modulator HflC [Gammaproteobacteria bacterium]MDH5321475.1 protease modulator HflC [Gammaproteobacteria bacterium]
MNGSRFVVVIVLGLGLLVFGLTAFTVNERELAIKLQVGEVVRANYEPGIHFKIPVYQTVRKFPARILKIDDDPQRVFTLERTGMQVDFFVQWRIVDEVAFYTSTGGSLFMAVDRLREIVRNSVVTEFGKRTVQQAISVEREALMRDMLASAAGTAQGLGIELVDFRVKQVEFVEEARNSVYNRMREERARVATETRAQGRERESLIRSTAEKDRTIILADANKEGQIIRGEGDAKAAQIYADAYNRDPEFYAFYRSIDAYRNSMGKSGDILVLDPNSDFFRYLNDADGSR